VGRGTRRYFYRIGNKVVACFLGLCDLLTIMHSALLRVKFCSLKMEKFKSLIQKFKWMHLFGSQISIWVDSVFAHFRVIFKIFQIDLPYPLFKGFLSWGRGEGEFWCKDIVRKKKTVINFNLCYWKSISFYWLCVLINGFCHCTL